jgi:hypothetical protein
MRSSSQPIFSQLTYRQDEEELDGEGQRDDAAVLQDAHAEQPELVHVSQQVVHYEGEDAERSQADDAPHGHDEDAFRPGQQQEYVFALVRVADLGQQKPDDYRDDEETCNIRTDVSSLGLFEKIRVILKITVKASNLGPFGNFGPFLASSVAS